MYIIIIIIIIIISGSHSWVNEFVRPKNNVSSLFFILFFLPFPFFFSFFFFLSLQTTAILESWQRNVLFLHYSVTLQYPKNYKD